MAGSFHKEIIHVTIHPILPRLERSDDRMAGGVCVLRSMLILGIITATNVAAREAQPEVHPAVTHL